MATSGLMFLWAAPSGVPSFNANCSSLNSALSQPQIPDQPNLVGCPLLHRASPPTHSLRPLGACPCPQWGIILPQSFDRIGRRTPESWPAAHICRSLLRGTFPILSPSASPDRSHASGPIPFPSSQSADQHIFIAMLDSFRPRVGFLPHGGSPQYRLYPVAIRPSL